MYTNSIKIFLIKMFAFLLIRLIILATNLNALT